MSPSLILRRIHLYLALFLMPWILMYALSTVVMNHRGWFEDYYGGHTVEWERIHEESYTLDLPEGSNRNDAAKVILEHLNLEGAFSSRGRLDRRITITRENPFDTRRIVYDAGNEQLLVARRLSRLPVILESLHRRRGYGHDILTEDLWAFSVDLVIVAMLFWSGSGIWMWWEMSVTRRLGAIALGAGVALYALFLLTL